MTQVYLLAAQKPSVKSMLLSGLFQERFLLAQLRSHVIMEPKTADKAMNSDWSGLMGLFLRPQQSCQFHWDHKDWDWARVFPKKNGDTTSRKEDGFSKTMTRGDQWNKGANFGETLIFWSKHGWFWKWALSHILWKGKLMKAPYPPNPTLAPDSGQAKDKIFIIPIFKNISQSARNPHH